MRVLAAFLLVVLVLMQVDLWIGPGSYAEVAELAERVEARRQENRALERNNAMLARQVRALKSGHAGIEARARHDLGMIREGETFFMLVPDSGEAPAAGRARAGDATDVAVDGAEGVAASTEDGED